jgi:uncharacterized protein (TIGR02466 family)
MDKAKSNLLQLYPTPVYISKLESITKELKELIVTEKYEVMYSGTATYTSNQQLLSEPAYKILQEEIDAHVEHYVRDYLQVNPNQKFYMTNSWGVCMPQGSYANPHAHTNSLISGCFYLNSDTNFGSFNINRNYDNIFTSTLCPEFTEYTTINSGSYSIQPEEDMIILMPSLVIHAVSPNQSTNSRYSVAFNYFANGIFGRKESYLEL